jgi:hypothetical protein
MGKAMEESERARRGVAELEESWREKARRRSRKPRSRKPLPQAATAMGRGWAPQLCALRWPS